MEHAFEKFLDEVIAHNPAGVSDVWIRAAKYGWDAALERAAGLVAKSSYTPHTWEQLRDSILALKSSDSRGDR